MVEAVYYLLTHCGGPLTDAQSADESNEDQIEHVDASSISSHAEIEPYCLANSSSVVTGLPSLVALMLLL